jgi:molecular chaperone GrpE
MTGKKKKQEKFEKHETPADEAEILSENEGAESEELTGQEKAALDWEQEREDLVNQLKRKQADLENLRRIGKIEQTEARQYALHEFLCRLLPVLDNLERALESARSAEDVPSSYIEGLELIRRQMLQIFEQEGVKEIEAVGTLFDPHCHHAVMQTESEESEPGTVLEELQKGYRLRERILRPSMVKICKE